MFIIDQGDLPLQCPTVAVLGNFDGVHTGHRELFKLAREKAAELDVPLMIWTFKCRPGASDDRRDLTTLAERLSFFEEEGAQMAFLADFEAYKDYSPSEFVNDILVDKFNVVSAVCGFNYTFGKNKSGTAELLKNLLEAKQKNCAVIPPYTVCGETVSSTYIRKLIAEGNVEKAAVLLGRYYSFLLPVSHGNEYGRTIGFPTANLVFPRWRVIPAFGVYASLCIVGGNNCGAEVYPSALTGRETNFGIFESVSNIGIRPTIAEKEKKVICETHIIGHKIDLYDKTIRVCLLKNLRFEKKFDSLEQLSAAVANDVETAKRFFDMSTRNEFECYGGYNERK